MNEIPGCEGLPSDASYDFPLRFTVDGYNVEIDEWGNVTVGGEGGGSTPTPSETPLTGIKLSAPSLEVEEGKTATLTATMEPENADDELKIDITSSDENATIESTNKTKNGITATIKGKKAGSATITVKGTKNPERTAQCTVTVKAVEAADTDASENTSYVGYYADLDGNPDTVEGIIYADLAVGHVSSNWNDGSYSVYEYETKGGLKKYTVGEEEKSGVFGTHTAPVITKKAGTNGADRFYVMDLEDLDNSYHYWYYNGYGKLPTGKKGGEAPGRVVGETDNDFGDGRENTTYWREIYDAKTYADPATGKSYTDLWGMEKLKTKINEGWFVPSKSEWAAFGDMCFNFEDGKMTTNNYFEFGLSTYYWSSSQNSADSAYFAYFFGRDIESGRITGKNYVRLSTTF